ncbi:protein yellow [Anabrus simplex]|uniref:protein yellow n=1 Tax=Anabrus simplex TaxID=316456 RepID=UPI0035A274C8
MEVNRVVILTLALLCAAVDSALREAFSWRQLDFLFPSQENKQAALASGQFKPDNNLPVGIELWEDKVFVTVPRWKSGVPASLAYFNLNDTPIAPFLTPYPDWESHNISDGNFKSIATRIVSPFRIRADSCDRLWVLDTGVADILDESPRAFYPTTLIVFDLKKNVLLRRYEFPKEHVKDTSFFANIAVDEGATCDDVYAYSADLGAFGLVVYSWKKNSSWRVQHNFFYAHPMEGEFDVHGNKFQWTDGLFGLALSKPNRVDGHRTLYFHPFASTSEFQVSTEILHNETRASSSYHEYHLLGTRGPNTQSCASFMDEDSGIIFYTQVNTDSITCWNSRTRPQYLPQTIGLVDKNNVTLIFPNDVKVDRKRNLWVLTDRLPMFMFGKLDPNDVNFRILTAPVDDATKDTICSSNYNGPEPKIEDRFGAEDLPLCRNGADIATWSMFSMTLLLLVLAVQQ